MGKVGGGVHGNVNKKAKRFELVRRRLGVEKKKLAGLRDKHLANVALVAAGARTGKAARRALRQGRRAAKAKLVRRRSCVRRAEQPSRSRRPACARRRLTG
jgi:hypothetical protein